MVLQLSEVSPAVGPLPSKMASVFSIPRISTSGGWGNY